MNTLSTTSVSAAATANQANEGSDQDQGGLFACLRYPNLRGVMGNPSQAAKCQRFCSSMQERGGTVFSVKYCGCVSASTLSVMLSSGNSVNTGTSDATSRRVLAMGLVACLAVREHFHSSVSLLHITCLLHPQSTDTHEETPSTTLNDAQTPTIARPSSLVRRES